MAVKEPVFSISGNIVCFDVMHQDIGTVIAFNNDVRKTSEFVSSISIPR